MGKLWPSFQRKHHQLNGSVATFSTGDEDFWKIVEWRLNNFGGTHTPFGDKHFNCQAASKSLHICEEDETFLFADEIRFVKKVPYRDGPALVVGDG